MAMWRKVDIPSAFDLASLGFLIGQGIGRWGNFTTRRPSGSTPICPWGMTGNRISAWLYANSSTLADEGIFVDYSQPVHPTFLYESLWCLLGFLLLHFLSKHRKYKGEIFILYSAWYGFGRFFIEGLRTDSLYIPGTYIRVSQVVAAVAFVGALIAHFVILHRIKQKEPLEPDYVPVFGNLDELSAESLRLRATELNAQAKELREQAERYRLLAQEDGDFPEEEESDGSTPQTAEEASEPENAEAAQTGEDNDEDDYRKSAEEAERRAIELEGQAKDYMQKAEELEAQEKSRPTAPR